MSSLDDLAGPAVANAVALYSARSGPAVRAILRRGYSEDATFDDGAVSVKGHPGTVEEEGGEMGERRKSYRLVATLQKPANLYSSLRFFFFISLSPTPLFLPHFKKKH